MFKNVMNTLFPASMGYYLSFMWIGIIIQWTQILTDNLPFWIWSFGFGMWFFSFIGWLWSILTRGGHWSHERY